MIKQNKTIYGVNLDSRITPLIVRDALIECFLEVHRADSGLKTDDPKINKEYIEKIDVIWLDHYLLGKETGLDFIAWCKADGSPYKHIPFFVVSNTASPDKVQTYLRLGVEKYYIKAEKRLDAIIKDINVFLRPAFVIKLLNI